MKRSSLKVKKIEESIIARDEKKREIAKNEQFFHSSLFPVDFFNDDFFDIAMKETTRGFLEEN